MTNPLSRWFLICRVLSSYSYCRLVIIITNKEYTTTFLLMFYEHYKNCLVDLGLVIQVVIAILFLLKK